jgi:hypothetical protein
MSRYVDRIVSTIHEAEEALSEDVRDQLTTPIIYSIILPFVLLDIWVSFR